MKRTPSISLFGTLPPIKGISEYCIEQARALSSKFTVEFHSFSSIYPEMLYPGGTKEYSNVFSIKESKTLKIKRILSWYNPFSWIYVALSSKGDVTHINWWIYILFPIFFTIAIISKLRGKRVLLTLHNVIAHESNILDKVCSSIMYRVADDLLVHTDQNKQTLMRSFHIDEKKIHILPYGPLNFLRDESLSQDEAKKYFGLTAKNKVVLFFGTIRKYKGLDILIQAFAKVAKTDKNIRLIIAGKNWVEWTPYQDLISTSKIDKQTISHIRYIPSDEIKYYFSAADVVVLPYTHFDAQSGVGNIAAAYGKPVIVSDVGGIQTLPNAKIFEKGNVNELAEKIKTELSGEEKQSTKSVSWLAYQNKYLKILSSYEK